MCDTIVALGNVTADGVTLFGKNSDREPNEAHQVVRIPAASHAPGENAKCTYIEIPQVEQTYAVLLAKPFWIWGAEMGANEHGVAIGNEAVFTKIPYGKEPGLIGMDFLRLALERTRTSRQALEVITNLLAKYGQSGNCGFKHATYYHNSFIIADPKEAWVLETADNHWAAEQVKDIRTISNGITIGNQFDLASPDLVSYAIDRGWCKNRDDFHFARCYSDFLFTRFSRCNERQCRTTAALTVQRGEITIASMMRALRDHGTRDPRWAPARSLIEFTVCAHPGFGPIRGTGTTGSMVSHLAPDTQTHFVTGTAAPCTSIFKPVWLGNDLPTTEPTPTGEYNSATLFWRHEALHRATLRNYATSMATYNGERDTLEKQFIVDALGCATSQRAAFSARCFAQADAAEKEWLNKIQSEKDYPGMLYGMAWRGFDRDARMI